MVEKAPNVQVQHPVHLFPQDPLVELIQRIVLATPRTESIRKLDKVLFVDRIHHLHGRPLD